MASGQQKAQQNVNSFLIWKATQSDDDFRQIIFRGSLNRGEIAKAIGCGKSALTQNPILKDELESLEKILRDKSVLPPFIDKANADLGKPKLYNNNANRNALDSKRLSSLEAENIELKAKIKELESRLERFGELSETLTEMGFMPR